MSEPRTATPVLSRPPDQTQAAAETPEVTGRSLLEPIDAFVGRHIGPSDAEIETMLGELDLGSLDALIEETVPASIRFAGSLELDLPANVLFGVPIERQVVFATNATAAFIGWSIRKTMRSNRSCRL